MQRTTLGGNARGYTLHRALLGACQRFGSKTALVDASTEPARRFSFAEYGELVERVARGLVAAGLRPGEVIGIYLPNSWEFAALYHAATLAGGLPTPLNPSYREREVRYQLENSGAVFLVSDGALLRGINLAGLPKLRRVFTTRRPSSGAEPFEALLRPTTATLPEPAAPPEETLAVLPYSSGTTGLPKGVMLTHANVVINMYQSLPPGEAATCGPEDVILCFLP
ncbi:MAG: AMP-binding protein, partial [Candidatus Acidiferrales bacterium]